jgi:ATP-binding cassette subfamily B protein
VESHEPETGARSGWGVEGRLLATYLDSQRARVALLAVLLLGGIALQLLNPQVVRGFIDGAVAATGHAASDGALARGALLFLVVALAQQAVSVGATYLSENIGWSATNALRADLLRHCLHLDQSFHKGKTPGELIERIDGDATTLAGFFSRLVVDVAGNLLLLVGILAVLWAVHWQIGLAVTLFVAVSAGVMRQVQALASPLWKVARQQGAELYGFITERLSGTEDLRSSGAQAYTLRRLCERMREQFRAERRARLTGRLVWTVSHVLFAAATAVTLYIAAQLYRTHGLSVGTVFSVAFYLGLIRRPLTQVTLQAEEFQKASAGIARVRELLATRGRLEAPEEDRRKTGRLPEGALSVAFREVRFAYEAEEEAVIRGLSLRLEAGRVLGLLGRTGSGKTTLSRLLVRLYDPQEGTVELGGTDIRTVPLAELRRRVGVVTQDVQLFHATVRDNLTLFDPGIPDARITQALEALGLRAWYDSLPEGLDTMLESGSGGLSAGEAQLLAFTRVFLRDPGLVILDEASSRLDPATERLVERAVAGLLRERTGIIIAHRLDTVLRADEILILDSGEVLEHGECEALRRDPGSRFSSLLRTGMDEALA